MKLTQDQRDELKAYVRRGDAEATVLWVESILPVFDAKIEPVGAPSTLGKIPGTPAPVAKPAGAPVPPPAPPAPMPKV